MMGSTFSDRQQQQQVPFAGSVPIQTPLYNTPLQPLQQQPFIQQPVYDTSFQQQPLYSTAPLTTQYIPPIQQQQPLNVGQDIQPQPGPQPAPCPSPEEFQQMVENDPTIAQIIDQIVQNIPPNACGVRPPTRRQETRVVNNNCPPRVANIRRRLPSPEPDIIERTTLIRSPQDRINITIEKPTMPPACVYEKTQIDTNVPPRISQQVVCVQPSQRECPPGSIPEQFTVASRYMSSGGMYQQPQNIQNIQQPQSQFLPQTYQQQQPYQQLVSSRYMPASQPYIPSQQFTTSGQQYIPSYGSTTMTQPTMTTPYVSTAKTYQQSSGIQPVSSMSYQQQPVMSSYTQQPYIQTGQTGQQYYWPQTQATPILSSSDTSDISQSGTPTRWSRGII